VRERAVLQLGDDLFDDGVVAVGLPRKRGYPQSAATVVRVELVTNPWWRHRVNSWSWV
jgi:hypothetical protein